MHINWESTSSKEDCLFPKRFALHHITLPTKSVLTGTAFLGGGMSIRLLELPIFLFFSICYHV